MPEGNRNGSGVGRRGSPLGAFSSVAIKTSSSYLRSLRLRSLAISYAERNGVDNSALPPVYWLYRSKYFAFEEWCPYIVVHPTVVVHRYCQAVGSSRELQVVFRRQDATAYTPTRQDASWSARHGGCICFNERSPICRWYAS